ncbi:unnamed protein product [Nippostrongylus brasiliensis]|uniref:Translocon-associated protein subunit beta n=1 Tax=Nippostrongylus brasiliensis TaxID=27835 RepID=A0A0N4YRM8_NIPBR|nr:unnamed protein product [Nippostrongylus brasiliensis]
METSEFVVQAAPHRLEQRRRTAMWIAALVPLSVSCVLCNAQTVKVTPLGSVTGDNALSSSTVVFDNETNLLNSGGNGTADAVSTHIEAFPNVIKTSFFISVGNGTADAVSTHIEAFPNVIKTSFFISAAKVVNPPLAIKFFPVTTVCVLLSCSFIIGIYEVHYRKKKRTVKSHT